MRQRLLNAGLVLSSLTGYLEWGGGQSAFLIEAEIDVLRRGLVDPAAVIHPLTMIPMLGQLMLLVTLFQHTPSPRLTRTGIAAIGLLLLLVLVSGAIGRNPRVVASVVPFALLAVLAVRQLRVQAQA